MMDPSKINRPVATVNRNAWFIRFYLWLWVADIEKIDFCRLFWGYVFAMPALVIKLLLYPIFLLWDGLVYMKRTGIWKIVSGLEWILDRTIFPLFGWVWAKLMEIIPQGDPKSHRQREFAPGYADAAGFTYTHRSPKKPSRFVTAFKSLRSNGGEVFLAGVGKAADRGIEASQNVWPYVKWIFIVIGALFAAGLALITGYALWLLIKIMPAVIGAIGTASAAAGEGIAWFAVTVFTSQYVWIVPLALLGILSLGILIAALIKSRPMQTAGKKSAEGTLKFGGAMKLGAKSVKYRTCPVIKVEE